MLGWFKKKFGKKEEEPVVDTEPIAVVAEEVAAPIAPVEPESIAGPTAQEPAAEVTAESVPPEEPAAVVEPLFAPESEEQELPEQPGPTVAESRVVSEEEPVAAVSGAAEEIESAATEPVAEALESSGNSEAVDLDWAEAAVEAKLSVEEAAGSVAPAEEEAEPTETAEPTEAELPTESGEEALAAVEAVAAGEVEPEDVAITLQPADDQEDVLSVDTLEAPETAEAEEAAAEAAAGAVEEAVPSFVPADGEDDTVPLEVLETAPEDALEEQEAEEPAVAASPVSFYAPTQEKPASKSMFKRLQERLGKTRDSFVYRIDRLFLGQKEIDQELFEQLEEILITADLGVGTTLELLDSTRRKVKRDQLKDPQALKAIIRDKILAYIQAADQAAELVMPEQGPFVIMVVGVNGVGKTTTIGKIAAKFTRAGQSVLMVAGDTFRAAAINQLKIWAERVGVEVIAQNPGSDPSSVVFDGLEYGVAHNYDVILIDTAGRLHTSVNLMEELKKIRRVINKKMPGAPHEVMLVLDATTGQNGISQAKLFHEAVGVSGLTLTKLDGTAKGGIVANVCRECKIPVRFIGIGEQLDDLRDFDAREFVDALFSGQANS